MRAKTTIVGVVVGLLLPTLAPAANLEGSFFGHAVSSVSDLPGQYTPGETYQAFLTLDAVPSSGDTWFPWDQENFEYTMVITATVESYTPGTFWFCQFGVATVSVFADAIGPGHTAATFANQASLTDGVEILSGVSTNLIASGSGGSFWGMFGALNFQGGSLVSSLSCHPNVSLQLNGNAGTVLPSPEGYDEYFDALWNCEGGQVVTGVADETWGRVKANYR